MKKNSPAAGFLARFACFFCVTTFLGWFMAWGTNKNSTKVYNCPSEKSIKNYELCTINNHSSFFHSYNTLNLYDVVNTEACTYINNFFNSHTFFLTYILKHCQDIANLLFWVLWTCLATPIKTKVSTSKKLWCLSTCKKSIWPLFCFSRYYILKNPTKWLTESILTHSLRTKIWQDKGIEVKYKWAHFGAKSWITLKILFLPAFF